MKLPLQPHLHVLAAFLCVGVFVSFPGNAAGADYTWSGGGLGNSWGESGNWQPSGTPAAGDSAVISKSVAVDIDGARSVGALSLGNGASLVGDGTLTAGAGFPWEAGGLLTFSGGGASIEVPLEFDLPNSKDGEIWLFHLEGTEGDVVEISGPVNIGMASPHLVRQEFENAAHLVISGTLSGDTGDSRLQIIPGNGAVTLGGDNHFTSSEGISFPILANGTTSTLYLAGDRALGDMNNLLRIATGAGSLEQDRTARLLLAKADVRIENELTVGRGAVTEIGGANTEGTAVWAGRVKFLRQPEAQLHSVPPVRLTAAEGGVVDFQGQIIDVAGGTPAPVEKTGKGTVVFSHPTGVSHQGVMTVKEGTLLVTNASGSGAGRGPLVVAEGGVLGGTGHIAPVHSGEAEVTVQTGGILLGGDGWHADGALFIESDLTVEPGGILRFVLGPAGMASSVSRASENALWKFADGVLVDVVLEDGAGPGRYPGILNGLSGDPGVASWKVATPGFENSSFTYDGSGNVDLQLAR